MRRVLSLCSVLSLPFCATAQEDPAQDLSKELGAAVKRLQDASSYSFTATVRFESDMWSGRGGEGGGRGPQEIQGKFSKDIGLLAKMGETEVYKKGEKVVYKDENGEWKLAAEPERRPGGAGGDEGGGRRRRERGGREGGGLRSGMIRRVRPPHEFLLGIESKLEKLTFEEDKIDEKEVVLLSGNLTPKGAEELMSLAGRGGGFRGGRRGGEEGAEVEREYSGKARFWLDESDNLVKYEVEIEVSMDWGQGPMGMTVGSTCALKDVGATSVEIPEEAKKALESTPPPPQEPKEPE